MKNKSIILTVIAMTLAVGVFAQTSNPPIFVKGSMDIKYNSRQNATPTKGVKDVYTLNVNVGNSVLFNGTITDTPQIIDGWISKTVVQARSLEYDINCDVVNPRNPAQTKNVGRMLGRVPINSDGVYLYDSGSLEISVLPIGNSSGFSSKFGGSVIGKPLIRPVNWMDSLVRETVNITRSVGGKTTTVTLKKYDKMEFRQHLISAGPIQSMSAVTVNGELFYDYLKNSWFWNGITFQYAENGLIKVDRISGIIRWVESPKRKTDGQGSYEFDLRFNEQMASANAAFETKVADEFSFFEVDTSVPSLTGKMSYADTLRGETTLASKVTIDLTSNNLTKLQVMAVVKTVLFSCVIPMNGD